MTDRFHSLPKSKPRAYRMLCVVTENGDEYSGIYWDSHLKQFREPVTGSEAEHMIGAISQWRYTDFD